MDKPVRITRFLKTDYYGMIGEYDRRKRLAIFEPQLPLDRLSKFVDTSVTAAASGETPGCLSCGVCCAFALIVPVRVDDTPRLDEYWDLVADDSDDQVVIDRVLPRDSATGYCVHLAGELKREISCRIYEDRPSLCHEFEAGSDRCHEYRRMYGVEPRLSDDDVVAELGKLKVSPAGVITFVSIVVDSVSTKTSIDRDEPDRPATARNYSMRIVGFIDDDTQYEIHTYDPDQETWFESDLIGMTLSEAREHILSSGKATKSD